MQVGRDSWLVNHNMEMGIKKGTFRILTSNVFNNYALNNENGPIGGLHFAIFVDHALWRMEGQRDVKWWRLKTYGYG